MVEWKGCIVQQFAHDDLALDAPYRGVRQQRILNEIVEVGQAWAENAENVVRFAGQRPSRDDFWLAVH